MVCGTILVKLVNDSKFYKATGFFFFRIELLKKRHVFFLRCVAILSYLWLIFC